MQILYYLVNKNPNMYCERVFAPAKDMASLMKEVDLPLYTLETKTPVKNCDVFGFTVQYELGYSNILLCLDEAGIPLLSKDRTESDPIIIAGGPCCFNPEPFAPFIDVIQVGDGEEQLIELLELARQRKIRYNLYGYLCPNLTACPALHDLSAVHSFNKEEQSIPMTRGTA